MKSSRKGSSGTYPKTKKAKAAEGGLSNIVSPSNGASPPEPTDLNAPTAMVTNGRLFNTGLYCICRGRVFSDFMVACENNDDCPHGGWLHPQCTEDLKGLSLDEIEKYEQWYCDDCKHTRGEKEDPKSSQSSEEASAVHQDTGCHLAQGMEDQPAQAACCSRSQSSSLDTSSQGRSHGHQQNNNKDGELTIFSTEVKEALQQRLAEVRSDQSKKLLLSLNRSLPHPGLPASARNEHLHQNVQRVMEPMHQMRDSTSNIIGFQAQAQQATGLSQQHFTYKGQAPGYGFQGSSEYGQQRTDLFDQHQRQQASHGIMAHLLQAKNQTSQPSSFSYQAPSTVNPTDQYSIQVQRARQQLLEIQQASQQQTQQAMLEQQQMARLIQQASTQQQSQFLLQQQAQKTQQQTMGMHQSSLQTNGFGQQHLQSSLLQSQAMDMDLQQQQLLQRYALLQQQIQNRA